MKYVPYFVLDKLPNIIVDGEANASTILTLSHWPNSRTHEQFQDDLSAQIVFNFLTSDAASSYAQQYGPTLAVSNNHFDEDGLVSLYAMLNPNEAMAQREFLTDIAAAGDFGVFRDRDAARVAFVLSAWSRQEQSPLADSVFRLKYPQFTNVLYEELLPRFPKIIEKLGNLAKYWSEEDEFLDATEDAIASRAISIQEYPELDLAIVHLPAQGVKEFSEKPPFAVSWISSVCHPMAIHNATDCKRILVMHRRKYELYFRYETWVDYRSRKLMPRVDLTPLARALTEEEHERCVWSFDGVDSIVPRLKFNGKDQSTIAPSVVESIVLEFLTMIQTAPLTDV